LIAGILVAVHLIFSLGLISLILLHAGKGGGLADAFGGGMGPLGNLGGSTMAERNLDRLTVTVALLFAFTTLALAWVL
jgi:preprotein translocase subunit SecG